MPHNHEQADATVTVTGVSLGCLNAAERRWEAVFIRHPEHSLMMEVVKESNGQRETVKPMTFIPVGCSITVKADNDANPAPQIQPAEVNLAEAFSQILDIENTIYGGDRVRLKEQPELPVTPLIVPGATLYAVAGRLTDFPVGLFDLEDDEGVVLNNFGRISTTAGADISCGEDGLGVIVSVEGEGGFEPIRLPRAEGTRYIIALDNTCPPAAAPRPEAAAGEAGAAPEDGSTGDSATNATRARVMLKMTLAGETVVENHSDFVIYYEFFDPPEGARKFDLGDAAFGSGPGAICMYGHLGRTGSIL